MQQFLFCVSVHLAAGWIAVNDAPIQRLQENTVSAGFNQGLVSLLIGAQFLLRALAVNRHGYLAGHKGQDLFFTPSKPDTFGISLGNHDTNNPVFHFKRDPQPVQGRCTNRLNFTASHHFLEHCRGCQQGFTCTEYILSQATSGTFWRRLRVILVHKIRERD